MSWDEGLDDMDQALLDPVSGFGSLVVIELASGESRSVSAIVDIESKSSGVHGGSVRGVVGKAELSVADVDGVAKGDRLIWGGMRYAIVNHPVLLNKKMVQLDLGVISEQSIPDIRY